MSQSPEPSTQHGHKRSTGSSLIEVIVALGILVIVTASIYPQVIAGIRAAGTARDITQAKGVAQARLEQMRSMPYYVGKEAGDYIDILDTYYRNTTPPPNAPNCGALPLNNLPPTTWTGYVSAGAVHCPWEPPGSLYRKVINPIQSPGLGAFAMVVSTQFLSGGEPPSAIAPRPGYDSQIAGEDKPSTSQVGVTVAVFYRTHGGVKYVPTYTQIERSNAMEPLIKSRAKATTVHISSAASPWSEWTLGLTDPANTNYEHPNLMSDVGIVDLSGELFTGSRVVANVTGAAASTSLPTSTTAASVNLVAAPDAPSTGAYAGSSDLPNGCKWICFGATRVDQVSATASDGLPNAGTPVLPARASIPNTTNRHGIWFDNGRWRNRLRLASGEPMVSLDTDTDTYLPGVRDCQVGAPGAALSPSHLVATGYLTSTDKDSPNREVSACSTAQSDTIRVFPTTFAPRGVVRITLDHATAHCVVRPEGSNSATSGYRATVQYWNGTGYTTVGTIEPGNTVDPLDSVDLNQVIDSSGVRLGDYVGSWSSLLNTDVERQTTSHTSAVDVPAVVTLLTGPTRTFESGWESTNNTDPSSVISLSVGAVSCSASDLR